jgi:hypothetical protein
MNQRAQECFQLALTKLRELKADLEAEEARKREAEAAGIILPRQGPRGLSQATDKRRNDKCR